MSTSAEKICPECGKPNQCQRDSGGPCWCSEVQTSKEAIEAKFGEFSMDKVCLCPECLAKYTLVPLQTQRPVPEQV